MYKHNCHTPYIYIYIYIYMYKHNCHTPYIYIISTELSQTLHLYCINIIVTILTYILYKPYHIY